MPSLGKVTLRGIRHGLARDPLFPNGIVLRPAPAGLLADSNYRAGLATLAAYDLSYDAMLYHCQIPELMVMARALLRLRIVLDNLGCILGVGPYATRALDTFAAWRSDMVELARCASVDFKIGGFGMIIAGERWHERPVPPTSVELADAWCDYVAVCIDLFSPDRCMFESNFLVDKTLCSYRTLWNAFKRVAGPYTDDETAALFSRTAARMYRIEATDSVS